MNGHQVFCALTAIELILNLFLSKSNVSQLVLKKPVKLYADFSEGVLVDRAYILKTTIQFWNFQV